MCEIQFIKRLDGKLNEQDLTEFITLMKLGNQYNNSAYGFFNDIVFYKDKGHFNKKSVYRKDLIKGSNFLVGHNRLETTGTKENNFNNHPFILNDFILVHNGIIQNEEELRKNFNIDSKIKTDSYVILWLFDYYFNKYTRKEQDREKRIIKAIRKVTKQIEGSYSIFLYDRDKNNLYYFKNNGTNFNFCYFEDKKVIIGTTDDENLKFVYENAKRKDKKSGIEWFNKIGKSKKPEDNTIYLINNEVIIKEIGKFKPKKTNNFYDYNNFYNYDYNNYYDITDIDNFFYMNLGYIPEEYTYDTKKNIVYINYNKDIYNDLKEFFDVDLKRNKIILDMNLISNI